MDNNNNYFGWRGPEMFRGMTYEQEIALVDLILAQATWLDAVAKEVGEVKTIQDIHRLEHPFPKPECKLCIEIYGGSK